MKYTKKKLTDALNRIDELACDTCRGSSDTEVELKNDYDYVFDFIKDMFKPMSEYMKGGRKK